MSVSQQHDAAAVSREEPAVHSQVVHDQQQHGSHQNPMASSSSVNDPRISASAFPGNTSQRYPQADHGCAGQPPIIANAHTLTMNFYNNAVSNIVYGNSENTGSDCDYVVDEVSRDPR